MVDPSIHWVGESRTAGASKLAGAVLGNPHEASYPFSLKAGLLRLLPRNSLFESVSEKNLKEERRNTQVVFNSSN